MGFVRGEIVGRTDWAEGLWTMQLNTASLVFSAGQFVNLALDIDGEIVKRAYSLASAPGEPLEFYLVEVTGGALTPRLYRMKKGDELMVEDQPQGFFTLEHVPQARDAWLMATGTGLGPFMSMLRSGDLMSRFETVVVVHGVRHAAHLGYRDELRAMAARPEGRVRYVPLVTREQADGVLAGRIPAAIADGRLESAADLGLSAEHSHVLLCGNPAMISDVTQTLSERGMRKHRVRKPGHITTEKYW